MGTKSARKNESSPSAIVFRRLLLVVGLAVALTGCDRSKDDGASQAPADASKDVIGRKIEFTAQANTEEYRIAGWSQAEAQFTWSEGKVAKMALPISAAPNGLNLRVTMAALIHPPDLPSQPVQVYVNGQELVEWQVGNTAEFVAHLPSELTKGGGTLLIEFRTPKATSPKTLGMSEDLRVLGISVQRLELAK